MSADHITFKRIFEDLQVVFDAAAKERPQRHEWVFDPMEGRQALGWIIYEREQMLQAVNRIRHTLNRPPVEMLAVWRCEISASGHSDYYRKFPLYCAELAMKDGHTP